MGPSVRSQETPRWRELAAPELRAQGPEPLLAVSLRPHPASSGERGQTEWQRASRALGAGAGAGRFPALFEPRVIFPGGKALPDGRAWAPREPGLLPMQVKGGPFLLSPSTSPDALLEKTPFKKGSR